MQTYTLNYNFTHLPSVLKRGRHALIAIQDNQGKIVLGGKDTYPPGIYRLAGGGIDKGEDPAQGAAREVEEELGIITNSNQLKQLALIKLNLEERISNKTYFFQTYLYHLKTNQPLHPADDLDEIKHFTQKEIKDLIRRYYMLSDQLIAINDDWDHAFRWSDYGQVYGKIHEIMLHELN
jgi:8-oxo-dGTP pyrophosphatase MutT (NUDIX family)